MREILCFGEALWDLPPGGMVPGGAPMNVALHLKRLGAPVSLLTRVGNDNLGERLLAYLADQGLATDRVQIDPRHPTGRVLVDLSDPQEARYEIEQPAAWDFIERDRAQTDPDVLVFGSLAARHEVSRATLRELIEAARLRVFDVNLRPPFVDRERIEALLKSSNWIKLNEHELDLLADWSRIGGDRDRRIAGLAARYGLDAVCVTLGGDGALLLHAGALIEQPGFDVEVVDTIGCGDSFLARWLWGMLSAETPPEALRRACALGALVATRDGANPSIEEREIRALIGA